MNILIALLVGAVLGGGTGWWFRRNLDYLVVDVLVGISGALLGLATYFFTHTGELSFWSLGGLLAAVVGAAICLLIFQLILLAPKKKHKKVEKMGDKEDK